jgi:hypothetical protein
MAESERIKMAKRHLITIKPRTAKYSEIYDIDTIFSLITSWPETKDLGIEQLRLKLILLLKIDTMARGDDLAKLYVHPLTWKITDTELVIRFYGTKESKFFTNWIGVAAYPTNMNLCTVATAQEYITRTKHQSKTTTTIVNKKARILVHPLFLDLYDGKPIHAERINNLTAAALKACGIASEYKGHSTRSAAISKAVMLGAFEERVMHQARLHDQKTLKRNYLRLTTGIGPQVPDKAAPLSHILRYTYTHAINSFNSTI